MFVYSLIWSGLKRLLVREGRAGRGEFVRKGLAPLLLSLFALLSGAAFPWLGEFGFVLIIAAVFFSRVGLAMAVRRFHDLGLGEGHIVSFRRQALAYFQTFVVLIFATAFLSVNSGNPAGSLVIAAAAAGAMTCILLGGSKAVMALATTAGEGLPSAHGLATPEAIRTLKAMVQAPVQSKPMPAHPLQSKVRTAAEAQPALQRAPRVRRVYTTGASQQQRAPSLPAQHPPPIVRKRGAIGEWT